MLWAALAAVAAASVPPGYGVKDTDAFPPLRFQRDTVATIATAGTEDVLNEDCGKPDSGIRLGCTLIRQHNLVVVPNPCHYPEDFYARILCHELGHVQGWGGLHEP